MSKKFSNALASRLVSGAGARGLPPELADLDQAKPARARSEQGRRALEAGKVAEQWVAGLCEERARLGLLWWVQIPDPYQVVKRTGDQLVVVPGARQHATDFVGGIPSPGGALLLGWEVKSCPHDAPSWGYSELRDTQVQSLDLAAKLGATACVLLVALEHGALVRSLYVLPWELGVGLPFSAERRSFPLADPRAEAYRLTPRNAAGWPDHPALAHNMRA